MLEPLKELCQPSAGVRCLEVGDKSHPARTLNRSLEVAEHELSGLTIQVDRAAGRQEREIVLNLLDDGPTTTIKDCAEPLLETKFATVLPDQIYHRQMALAAGHAEPATELLAKNRCGLRRAEQQDRVHVGNVNALAENLHRKDAAHPSRREIAEGGAADVLWIVAGEGDALEAGSREPRRHVAGMLFRDAEPERLHILRARTIRLMASSSLATRRSSLLKRLLSSSAT